MTTQHPQTRPKMKTIAFSPWLWRLVGNAKKTTMRETTTVKPGDTVVPTCAHHSIHLETPPLYERQGQHTAISTVTRVLAVPPLGRWYPGYLAFIAEDNVMSGSFSSWRGQERGSAHIKLTADLGPEVGEVLLHLFPSKNTAVPGRYMPHNASPYRATVLSVTPGVCFADLDTQQAIDEGLTEVNPGSGLWLDYTSPGAGFEDPRRSLYSLVQAINRKADMQVLWRQPMNLIRFGDCPPGENPAASNSETEGTDPVPARQFRLFTPTKPENDRAPESSNRY